MKNSSMVPGNELSGIIKIIGIGQSLRGDDAAGLAAVRLWQETLSRPQQTTRRAGGAG